MSKFTALPQFSTETVLLHNLSLSKLLPCINICVQKLTICRPGIDEHSGTITIATSASISFSSNSIETQDVPPALSVELVNKPFTAFSFERPTIVRRSSWSLCHTKTTEVPTAALGASQGNPWLVLLQKKNS